MQEEAKTGTTMALPAVPRPMALIQYVVLYSVLILHIRMA